MAFTWDVPPWRRHEDCTYMATLLSDDGHGQVGVNSVAVRGDNATDALADLLMGPGAVLLSGLIGVVIRQGIDVMWMAQPPIEVASAGENQWNIAVDGAGAEVTVFSGADMVDMRDQLHAQYGAG